VQAVLEPAAEEEGVMRMGELSEAIAQHDALGELLRDCLRLLDSWDRANWEELPEFAKAGEEYEPEGNYAAIIEKAKRLGVEVR